MTKIWAVRKLVTLDSAFFNEEQALARAEMIDGNAVPVLLYDLGEAPPVQDPREIPAKHEGTSAG